jgi:predicted ATPase
VRQIKAKRRRGVLLTDHGLSRVHDAVRRSAVDQDGGRIPLESFSASIGLSTRTLSRVLNRASPIDLRTLEALFFALRLTPSETDYNYATDPARLSVAHLLPRELTPLMGRETLLGVLEPLLEASRLLTLTGAGGVGKTRVAIELARRRETARAEPVWFFEFTAETDLHERLGDLATVLGVAVDDSGAFTTLAPRLKEQEALLVLDNCEGPGAALGNIVLKLLRLFPTVRILATSRETFGIEGECIFRIPALEMPEPRKTVAAEETRRYPAIALFEERARFRNATFSISDAEAPIVAEIVHRLDGLPLAIELAAARAGEMSSTEILSYLRKHLSSLSAADNDPRHRSMRALMDWSFDRLSEHERFVYTRTAVFNGTFDGAALSAICSDVLPPERTLEAAFQLARKSLLEIDVQATPTRFALLETIRAYVRERLEETSDLVIPEWNHSLHYLHVAADLMRPVREQGRTENIHTLAREYPNVRGALEWSFSTNNAHLGAALAAELAEYWETRGQYHAGEEWLRRALESRTDLMANRTRALLYEGLALLLHRQMRPGEAYRAATHSFEIFEQMGDDSSVCRVQNLLGLIDFDTGNMGSARMRHLANLRRGELLNPRITVATLLNLGRIERDVDKDNRGALGRFEKSLHISMKLGRRSTVALSLSELADTHAALGNLFHAVELGRKSMQVFHELENGSWYCRLAFNVAIWQIRAVGFQQSLPDARVAYEALLVDPYNLELYEQLDLLGELLVDAGKPDLAVTLLTAAAYRLEREDLAVKMPTLKFSRQTLRRARRVLGLRAFNGLCASACDLSVESAFRQTLILPFAGGGAGDDPGADAMLPPRAPARVPIV